MFREGILVGGLLFFACCANVSNNAEDEPIEPGVIASAIGNEDTNDFRNRKTELKTFAKRKQDCATDPRVALGLVSQTICVGADLFFREPFGGNGRACGTCHTAQFDFTISPEFVGSLAPDDPLFVAEYNPALAGLEKPTLMRDLGLILENVDGAEAPTTKFVMRSVPHAFSLSTSVTPPPIVNADGTAVDGTTNPPIERTGWSGDGAPAPGGLKQFQAGAIFQHYTKSLARQSTVDFTPATDEQLNDIEAFLRSVGRSADVDLGSISLSDPGAETGRTTFISSRCNGCHRNASANNGAGVNRNFDTGVEAARPAILNTMGIPHDGGFGGAAPGAPFNHDSDRDGMNDSYGNGTFNTPPLIEAADTGPFFHVNNAQTIEDAITFYTTPAFASSPAGGGAAIPFNATDIANVGKFLRVLNAAFNTKIATKRLDAAIKVINQYQSHYKGLQAGLLDAAQAEVRDAIADLDDVGINAAEVGHLKSAAQSISDALSNSSQGQRLAKAMAALTEAQAAEAGLGSGLTFSVGDGSIMF